MGEMLKFNGSIPDKFSSGGGGGNMEKRVADLEKTVNDVRVDVATIKNQVLHLATSAKVEEISAQLPHLATKSDIRAAESSLIKWTIGAMFGFSGLIAAIAFGVSKLAK